MTRTVKELGHPWHRVLLIRPLWNKNGFYVTIPIRDTRAISSSTALPTYSTTLYPLGIVYSALFYLQIAYFAREGGGGVTSSRSARRPKRRAKRSVYVKVIARLL